VLFDQTLAPQLRHSQPPLPKMQQQQPSPLPVHDGAPACCSVAVAARLATIPTPSAACGADAALLRIGTAQIDQMAAEQQVSQSAQVPEPVLAPCGLAHELWEQVVVSQVEQAPHVMELERTARVRWNQTRWPLQLPLYHAQFGVHPVRPNQPRPAIVPLSKALVAAAAGYGRRGRGSAHGRELQTQRQWLQCEPLSPSSSPIVRLDPVPRNAQ